MLRLGIRAAPSGPVRTHRAGYARSGTRPLGRNRPTRRNAQAQALHTLSKLRDGRARPAITKAHLHDPDDEVARTAWRTAVGLAPEAHHQALADELTLELGRGDLDVHRSLARALVELGDAGEKAAQASLLSGDAAVRVHSAATIRLIQDPEASFHLDPADA